MKETAMECARFDWKAYALGDLSVTETAEYERHVHNCEQCRVELSRWQPLVVSLRSLPQVDPPRRIVFAPEPAATEAWWQRLWHSGPQLGFASAAVLALAIVAHGLIARVAVAPSQSAQTEARIQAGIQASVQASVHEAALKEINRLVPQAVDAALTRAQSKTIDSRLRGEIDPALASFQRRLSQEEQLRLAGLEQKREADQKAVRYAFERLERRVNYVMLSSARPAGGE